MSEIERSRPESERRKCPKSDGTVRNQMVLSVIRRKRSESGGNVRNQTEASCGIRDLCQLFSLLANRKKTQEIEQYYRYRLNTCNKFIKHSAQIIFFQNRLDKTVALAR